MLMSYQIYNLDCTPSTVVHSRTNFILGSVDGTNRTAEVLTGQRFRPLLNPIIALDATARETCKVKRGGLEMPSGIEIELRLAWVVEGAERSQCKPSEAEITPEQRDLKNQQG
ncbi:hypothetical protein An04g08870 [Aspergillus niger]|uniref:Uncharacterized protein n=2 Tax=Aspergillus niger TaxID=5061 RepID=A2QK02_ASPNC|nr:hypothetical protein An04g08870 [Aspergillus niger]CAK38974.1 hypothetical protein An04g08870 [Aspergillus niger]